MNDTEGKKCIRRNWIIADGYADVCITLAEKDHQFSTEN
jgi:hypothetical protein